MAERIPPGEFGLIGWIRDRRPPLGEAQGVLGDIGDDCATVDLRAGLAVLTTDMLMDGRHFHLDRHGPEAVGGKAMGVNISDVAAMAAIPRFALVAVALPRGAAGEVARGLDDGLRRMADRFGVHIVGGDTNAWDGPLVICVTLLGQATATGVVTRSGAKAGDAVLVTGPLGGSLFRGRHLRPTPRVEAALELARRAKLHAMIDLSDGLSSDLGHILVESGGLGAVLREAEIPVHDDAIAMSRDDGVPAVQHALHDGEDFELCFTLPASEAEALLADPPAGVPLSRIGEVVAEPGLRLRSADGRIEPVTARGFDHLREAAP